MQSILVSLVPKLPDIFTVLKESRNRDWGWDYSQWVCGMAYSCYIVSSPATFWKKKKTLFQRAALKHWKWACFFSMQHWNAGTGDEAMLHSHTCTYCACARLVQVESKRCSQFVCFYGTTWWYIARSFWGSNQTTPCTPNTEIINHTCMVSMSTYMYM